MQDFAALYAGFQAPIAALDCGDKCAPYNERGVPFCCDTRHAIPTAYREEWDYLKANTDLWHPWEAEDESVTHELVQETPGNQVLVECQGHLKCQRNFRTLTCRSFPFFPYIDKNKKFVGLSYYWEYEDRCWVISNLQVVSLEYRRQFCALYDVIFAHMPDELQNFQHHSEVMRRIFSRHHRAIPLLHRNGKTYKVSPGSGRMRRVTPADLPKFGPYKIAAELPFPDELEPVRS
jgi:hypothetical protein